MSKQYTMRLLILSSLTALVLTACGGSEESTAAATARPAPTVDVANVVSQRITEWDQFTGRLQAPQTVQLMPRVSGYLQQVNFKEGALVNEGDLLFQIDAAPFQTEVLRLKAQLQSSQAAQTLANSEYTRAEKLHKKQAISEEMLETRFANKHQAAASVASQQAALTRAELELAYTQIKAPITGRVSYAQVTAGNYVTAGKTELTRLVSTEKMYAYFDVDEQSYLGYTQLMNKARLNGEQNQGSQVYMALTNDKDYHYLGHIDFVDNAINPRTGTIRLRATFSNDSQRLLPGLFARIKLMSGDAYQGILIDEKAIGTDLNNKFVLVVNDEQTLEYRSVLLGEKINGLRIVTSGLKASDEIVVNGLQRVRPSMQVTPNKVAMATAAQLTQLQREQQTFDDNAEAPLTVNTASQQNRG
ncbi:efflux RND transporter periplasmic adaptor subunit [Shewanella surugensis]|uniref:Efflux RND transporter periplasmic adaptor subunit n=1 Tax=Shewanella surugensis TaxID=212020 RepID=A0ABT0L833_9GAMM|nr:efflux RND transporter periplasmic adaptor subunit [Shewanella surugensis]MCL1123550.1 efflux RND transporter periplasmic adaptor subunit [Shewanella surugensis]